MNESTVQLEAYKADVNKHGGFCVNKAANDQTGIVANTWTQVTWSQEEFDTNGSFDLPNNRMLVPTGQGGLWLVGAHGYVAGQPTSGTWDANMALYKNGSIYHRLALPNFNINSSEGLGGSVLLNTVAGDYYELYIHMNPVNSSGTLRGNTDWTYFWGVRLGP